MTSPASKPFRQFSMRCLLALVAVIALLMVPVSYCYRAYVNRPDCYAIATLMIRGPDADRPQYKLDPEAIRGLILDEPQIQDVRPIRKSTDSGHWLSDHVSIRVRSNTNLVEVTVQGRSERLTTNDLHSLLDTTIDAIRSDAMKKNTRVTVISTSITAP